MTERHFDSIVIGTGPAGEGAAMKLAKAGQRVAVIERSPEVGGACTHLGTIPSKALRHAVQRLADYRNDPLYRRVVGPVAIGFSELLSAAGSVIRQQSSMRERFYHRNQVELVTGRARLLDAHTVEIEPERGAPERLASDYVVLAMGSRPYRPPDVDFTHPRVHDSDTIVQPGLPPRSGAMRSR